MHGLGNIEKFKPYYLFECHRAESFIDWPFDSSSSCSVEKMAAAGFYWIGNNQEPDTVTCFVCGKTLDGWEVNDDPWKEHAKHAPQCMFVQYGRKEEDLNVEEFLNIFGKVIKGKIQKSVEAMKCEMRKWADDELMNFHEVQKLL